MIELSQMNLSCYVLHNRPRGSLENLRHKSGILPDPDIFAFEEGRDAGAAIG